MKLLRVLVIAAVFLRHGLDAVVFGPRAGTAGGWRRLLPGHWRRDRLPARGVRLRRALEDLGPIFVKFGQLLSVRPDVVPEDVAHELGALRDRVPPFPGEAARRMVAAAYGCELGEVFAEFDIAPVASASIAQVHRARLGNGTEVMVKVVRPGIDVTIARDVALMGGVAAVLERVSALARRLRAREVVAEYARIIHDELDMVREAANASQLARNFAGSDLLEIPAVHWEHTRERVLVLERIEGIPVDDVAGLRAAGVDVRRLAERGVEIFFTQVFRHNFFHADMHPGNIFVRDPRRARAPDEDPGGRAGEPRYIAIDFGIMGSLSREDQRYLAENFVAFFNRDYRRVAELHVASGWVPAGTRVVEFEAAIRSVCEPIFQRPLAEISLGQLLVRLFQTARRFDMSVQPQLVLLQKTLLHVEGLGRRLYPELDLWLTAKPFLEEWMRERQGPGRLASELIAAAPRWLALLSDATPDLPWLAAQRLGELERRGREPPPPAAPPPAPWLPGVLAGGLVVAAAVLFAAGGVTEDGERDLVWPALLLGAGAGVWLGRRLAAA